MAIPYVWEGWMQCLQCQYENASNAKFCNQCAAPFAPVCSACGHENTADAQFCNQCGTPFMVPTGAASSVQLLQRRTEAESRFIALLRSVMWMLQREGRVTYRELKYVFGIDDGVLTEIADELRLNRVAIDEENKVLVWTGEHAPAPLTTAVAPSPHATAESTAVSSLAIPAPPSLVTPTPTETHGPTASLEVSSTDVAPDEPVVVPEFARNTSEAEHRQLTVMFCDLMGSTDLSGKLDPEDLREVVRAYQATAAEVIQQYEGHMAQYLGDGLLIYFGWPVAHEDDAQRSLHAGLGIVEAITATLNPCLEQEKGVQLTVRLGVHTGPVVVGEMGGGERHENLATGETVNIAARLEGLAPPNTVVISSVTARLVARAFALEDLGPHALKGLTEPMQVSPKLIKDSTGIASSLQSSRHGGELSRRKSTCICPSIS